MRCFRGGAYDPQRCLIMPAYDFVMKASHAFNILDARGAISVTERQRYIGRVRNLARKSASAYVRKRAELGFPLLPEDDREAAREAFDAALERGVNAAALASARAVGWDRQEVARAS